jgi:hypothetical protein
MREANRVHSTPPTNMTSVTRRNMIGAVGAATLLPGTVMALPSDSSADSSAGINSATSGRTAGLH